LTSAQYAAEFNEVKPLGSNSATSPRTAAQTDLARFFTAYPLPMMHSALRSISKAKGLSITRAARLFGMVSASGADALIGCWDDKDYWSFWRPITAIHAVLTTRSTPASTSGSTSGPGCPGREARSERHEVGQRPLLRTRRLTPLTVLHG
jgi:hypothetical protein